MPFIQTLRQIVADQTEVVEDRDDADAQAAAIIAHFAPHLLRRLAEVAGVLDAPGLHAGQGAILACRSRADGYRAVEYDAPDLSVTFDVLNGEAHLRWHAGDELNDRRIAVDTPEIVIDTALLDAVSAYANRRVAPVTA
ncbi:MAG: hypothetical protein M3176_14730 [Chloroflexota bacterium]|nr:hypothetical protein [Chloroflexota bacterium]